MLLPLMHLRMTTMMALSLLQERLLKRLLRKKGMGILHKLIDYCWQPSALSQCFRFQLFCIV
ncbi:hypothetical protein AKJ16_DCAP27541 [Drosera capensis]